MCKKTRAYEAEILHKRGFKVFSKLADIQINLGYCLVGVANIIHPLFLVWAAISFHDTHVNFGGT